MPSGKGSGKSGGNEGGGSIAVPSALTNLLRNGCNYVDVAFRSKFLKIRQFSVKVGGGRPPTPRPTKISTTEHYTYICQPF